MKIGKLMILATTLLIGSLATLVGCSEEETAPSGESSSSTTTTSSTTTSSTSSTEMSTIETERNLKYDFSKWNSLFGSPTTDQANDLVLTPDGKYTYVVGYAMGNVLNHTNNGWGDIILTKHKPTGELIWAFGLGSPGHDVGYGIALSPDNRYIYIVGEAGADIDDQTNQGGADILIAKYDSRGIKVWTKLIGSPSADKGMGIAISPDNQYIYIVGYTDGTIFGDPSGRDAFIAKLTVEGTLEWGELLTSNATYSDEAYNVVVSPDGNAIYMAGVTRGNMPGNTNPAIGVEDLFVAKYTPEGTVSWIKQLGAPNSDYAYNLALSPDGNYVYVVGRTYGNLDGETNSGNDDAFIVKYDSAGTKQWTKLFGTPASDYANGVVVGTSGMIYVTGITCGDLNGSTNNGGCDAFITKHTPDGTITKTILLGSPTGDAGTAITISPNEHFAVIAGYASGYMPNLTPGSYHHGAKDMLTSKAILADTDGIGNLTNCTPTFSDINDTINIEASGTLQDIQVGVTIAATCTQDVDIYLKHGDTLYRTLYR